MWRYAAARGVETVQAGSSDGGVEGLAAEVEQVQHTALLRSDDEV
jgi:hypothetical protein